VSATKVTASGVSAPTSVLRLCGREETDYGQHNRKDARRSHKEGNSSGHGLPTPGNPFVFYSRSGASGTLQVPMSASRQKLEVFALKKGPECGEVVLYIEAMRSQPTNYAAPLAVSIAAEMVQ